jgi:hypothetical protein
VSAETNRDLFEGELLAETKRGLFEGELMSVGGVEAADALSVMALLTARTHLCVAALVCSFSHIVEIGVVYRVNPRMYYCGANDTGRTVERRGEERRGEGSSKKVEKRE